MNEENYDILSHPNSPRNAAPERADPAARRRDTDAACSIMLAWSNRTSILATMRPGSAKDGSGTATFCNIFKLMFFGAVAGAKLLKIIFDRVYKKFNKSDINGFIISQRNQQYFPENTRQNPATPCQPCWLPSLYKGFLWAGIGCALNLVGKRDILIWNEMVISGRRVYLYECDDNFCLVKA